MYRKQVKEAPIEGSCTEGGNPLMQDDVRAGERMIDDEGGRRVRVTNRRPSEHIDGAWWPRSTDLARELPALLSTLWDRLGRVVMVGYLRNGWTDTPPEIDVAGHRIELLAFDSAEPASVIVIGHDGRHLTLRVIPSETSEQSALQALDAIPARGSGTTTGHTGSAVVRSVADVADRLARHEGRGDEERNAELMRWCEEAAAQFDEARIQTFVPILVEHIVRNRMYHDRAATRSPSDTDSREHSRAASPRTL
jgi:hypothetical protein